MFENVEPSARRMKSSFAFALWSWDKIYIDFEFVSVTDFFCSFQGLF